MRFVRQSHTCAEVKRNGRSHAAEIFRRLLDTQCANQATPRHAQLMGFGSEFVEQLDTHWGGLEVLAPGDALMFCGQVPRN